MSDPASAGEAALPHQFVTTQWSTVLAAGADTSQHASAALERLCRAYWYPLYVYVRRQGSNAEDAEDLTQMFFAHLLERKTFRQANQERGRFRSFLLTSLKHFLINVWERGQAQKRGGRNSVISLDDEHAEKRYLLEPAIELTPDKLFDRRWAITILEQALQRVRQEQPQGKERQFEVLKGFLSESSPPGAYPEVAAELGTTPDAVAVAVHRLRHRYREEIRNQIAQTVTTSVELDEEMRHLFAALNG